MRDIDLNLASGEDLEVIHFSVTESMSEAFQIQCVAVGPDDLRTADLIGKRATFALRTKRGRRRWTGVSASVQQADLHPDGRASYQITIAPDLWLLEHRHNYRTFQHLSAPEIAEKLLAEWDIRPDLQLRERHPKLEFRVQYGETDRDFLARLLVDAGISYYFKDAGDEDTKLVLSDAPHLSTSDHKRLPFTREADDEPGEKASKAHAYVTQVTVASKPFVSRVTLGDFDFRRPRYPVAGKHAHEGDHHPLFGEYHFAPGHSLAEARDATPGATPLADSHGAYRHQEARSRELAQRQIDAARSGASKITFETSHIDLPPGSLFGVEGHPHPELSKGQRLLVTDGWITGSSDAWTAGGEAVPASQTYRPALKKAAKIGGPFGGDDASPPIDPRGPRILGVQSALVVGPAGEEIYADEHGRVRVQFAWDREGKHDEKSSCWVRVSQASAGASFGSMQLPRVGEEVLVSFLDGDPNHPVIVGRLHNPTSPEPYPLPEHKTRSTWKSHARAGAGNEITFEDRREAELFYVQARRDLHKLVMQHELEHTLGDRHMTVEGDLILSAKGKVIISGEEIVVRGAPHIKLNPTDAEVAARKPAELSTGAPRKGNQSAADIANEALLTLDPGPQTAAKHDAAQRRLAAEKYKDLAVKLGEKHAVPPALLLGWMSQESGLGEHLKPDGYDKVDGYGYGLLQVDRRYHSPKGDAFGEGSVEQGIHVLKENLANVRKAHPTWTREEQLAGALVDYNAGAGSARARPSSPEGWSAMDESTAPENRYSRSVWAQAAWFAQNLKW